MTSIATFELLVNDTLILRDCNLSAMLPRSTFTKYHLLDSQGLKGGCGGMGGWVGGGMGG